MLRSSLSIFSLPFIFLFKPYFFRFITNCSYQTYYHRLSYTQYFIFLYHGFTSLLVQTVFLFFSIMTFPVMSITSSITGIANSFNILIITFPAIISSSLHYYYFLNNMRQSFYKAFQHSCHLRSMFRLLFFHLI